MWSRTIIQKLAFLALAGGLMLGTTACAKKSFESLNQDNGLNGNNNGGGGTTGGGTTGGTTGGGTTGGTGGGTTGGTTGGGTTGGTGGGTTGGTTGGGTTGGTTGGGTTGGTTGGGTTGGTTGGGTTGGTTGGGTTGGTTGGGTTGGTTGGGTTGGTTGGGCDPFDPDCTIDPKFCVTEKYVQPEAEITRKLDIWIVTDSSASMDNEREKLANGVLNFISKLPTNVDARLAVSLAHGPTSWFSGRLYKSDFKDPNEKFVISSKSYNPSQIQYWMRRKLLYKQKDYGVRAWDNNGTQISGQALRGLPTDYDAGGGEAGLYSVHDAMRDYPGQDRYESIQNLDKEVPGELNFFRNDAALAVIFISDENDICSTGANNPDPDGLEAKFRNQYCSGITPQSVYSKLLQRRQSLPLYVSSIIYNDPSRIGADPLGEKGVGYGYNTFTQLANGTIIDIADNNIPGGLSNIGALTSTRLDLRYDFPLSYQNVDPTTIEVGVDNILRSHTYKKPTNTVHLTNAGGAKSKIEIYYCLEKGKDLIEDDIYISNYLLQKAPQTYKPSVTVKQEN